MMIILTDRSAEPINTLRPTSETSITTSPQVRLKASSKNLIKVFYRISGNRERICSILIWFCSTLLFWFLRWHLKSMLLCKWSRDMWDRAKTIHISKISTSSSKTFQSRSLSNQTRKTSQLGVRISMSTPMSTNSFITSKINCQRQMYKKEW